MKILYILYERIKKILIQTSNLHIRFKTNLKSDTSNGYLSLPKLS